MANSQTNLAGFDGGQSQITTLNQIQGAGLSLPPNAATFINTNAPGKLQVLFTTNDNDETLYNKNKFYFYQSQLTPPFYVTPNQGRAEAINASRSLPIESAIRDTRRVLRFLASGPGVLFLTKQVLLQGFQPFDETKIYNPVSSVIAAARLATLSALDRPKRHIDLNSGLIGGISSVLGVENLLSTINNLSPGSTGEKTAPRSTVASDASSPGSSNFSGFTGPGKIPKVLAPAIRDGATGLIRGTTATEAYNGKYYSTLLAPTSGGKLLDKVLQAAGSFLKNNTVAGAIIPPKQPVIGLNYRADEDTYSLLVKATRWTEYTTITGGDKSKSSDPNLNNGNSLLNDNDNYAFRFWNGANKQNNINRLYLKQNIDNRINSNIKSVYGKTPMVGKLNTSDLNTIIPAGIIDVNNGNILFSLSNKYGDVIKISADQTTEYSDQLYNYLIFTSTLKGFQTSHVDRANDKTVKIIDDSANDLRKKVAGSGDRNYLLLQEFGKIQQYGTNNLELGFQYLKKLSTIKAGTPENLSYVGKVRTAEEDGTNKFKFPTILGKRGDKDRFINPTNDVDYVNSLGVLNPKDFTDKYDTKFNGLGPDLIKFYFYDIVNDRFIPFSAIINNISDNTYATWETIKYLGRADELQYYSGFARELSFGFKVVAHSIKELLPMWQRINYLVGLTKPSNYTSGTEGGFIVPPMVQLTLGDFFKNHFICINSCNVTIPEGTSWELVNENYMQSSDKGWEFNIGKLSGTEKDKKLKGKVGQFPREADIQISAKILEKDRPKVGRSHWGDAPVPLLQPEDSGGEFKFAKDNYSNKNYNDASENKFSYNVRYDVDVEGKT